MYTKVGILVPCIILLIPTSNCGVFGRIYNVEKARINNVDVIVNSKRQKMFRSGSVKIQSSVRDACLEAQHKHVMNVHR